MNKNINKKGFTIIEVVLVLAIAGLIFLMVFVALPRLQMSQRDTQRRDDVAAVATAITQYQSNNSGAMPADASPDTTLVNSYLAIGGATFNQPNSETPYTLNIITATTDGGTTTPATLAEALTTGEGEAQAQAQAGTTIVVVKGVTCGVEGELVPGQARNYAVGIQLEGSGYYCTDN
ncbi:type II secretion system protein [Candidatus Saccharibacteria bacterium]|nr:type II secretion system protein [Candidatus Saccharibacteria bacterium]